MMNLQQLYGANGAGQRMMVDNLMKGANGEGQRIMFDSLATKDNTGFNIGVPGMGSIGANWSDNSLTCDSAGNCMLKDSLSFLTTKKSAANAAKINANAAAANNLTMDMINKMNKDTTMEM
jgi:hypothetical protein